MKAVHLTGYGMGVLDEEVEAVESSLKEYDIVEELCKLCTIILGGQIFGRFFISRSDMAIAQGTVWRPFEFLLPEWYYVNE